MADVGYLSGAPVKTKGGEWGILAFTLNIASGVPTVSEDYDGVVDSVADTDIGKYTVTLADNWAIVQGLAACPDNAAGIHSASMDCSAPQTVIVLLQTAGSLDDVDGDIDCTVLVRRNTDGGT